MTDTVLATLLAVLRPPSVGTRPHGHSADEAAGDAFSDLLHLVSAPDGDVESDALEADVPPVVLARLGATLEASRAPTSELPEEAERSAAFVVPDDHPALATPREVRDVVTVDASVLADPVDLPDDDDGTRGLDEPRHDGPGEVTSPREHPVRTHAVPEETVPPSPHDAGDHVAPRSTAPRDDGAPQHPTLDDAPIEPATTAIAHDTSRHARTDARPAADLLPDPESTTPPRRAFADDRTPATGTNRHAADASRVTSPNADVVTQRTGSGDPPTTPSTDRAELAPTTPSATPVARPSEPASGSGRPESPEPPPTSDRPVRTDGQPAQTPPLPPTATPTDTARSARTAGPESVERILEAAAELEHTPPPRRLVLEIGESRIRISLDDDGQVRLAALTDDDAARDLLAQAEQSLGQRDADDSRDERADEPGSTTPDQDTSDDIAAERRDGALRL